jgi:metallo-beta-lactamase family protein
MTTIGEQPTITFLGAAGTVTGSRFLLSCGETNVMVDCGLFQGLKELRLKNWAPLAIDAANIDAVLLTHAHLDHCGYIPKLVEQGYKGKIHSTKFTAKLAAVILRDSARIQTEDAKYAAKKGFSKHNPPKPLYDEDDAEKAIQSFQEEEFDKRIQVATETFVTFHPSGHILGSATLEVEFFGKKLMFSGDLGRDGHPLLVNPEKIVAGKFDALITESTYGDREHVASSTDFETAINETIKGGGSVLIPAFAVDRTEIILVKIRELMEAGTIPKVPVFADSPMALKALNYYRQAINEGSSEIREEIRKEWAGRDPFDPGSLVELETVEQSKTINDPSAPCIIISASGMGTGGRVVHHLRQMLPNSKHTVLFVGYQALGTRGRSLVDGAETVKMHGELVPVRARVEQIAEFSVHADSTELIDWLSSTSVAPGQVFVVHGEAGAAEAFSDSIESKLGWKSMAPKDGQQVNL